MFSKIRRILYRSAGTLGDWDALLSGCPKKMLQRKYNKFMGRNVSRRINTKGRK